MALWGYIGDDSEFDKAIAEFAMAYANQTTRDWRDCLDAIKAGRLSPSWPIRPTVLRFSQSK
jgi:hypothetical protein